MIRSHTALLALISALALPAAAQRVVDTSCHNNSEGFLDEYGRAVAVGVEATDVLIGAPEIEEPWPGRDQPGAVFPRVGPVIYGDDHGDRFGAAVAAGLDLDGDALPDGAAGAPGDDDAGDGAGSVRALAGAGGALYTVHGDAAGDGFGTSLAALGDLDGDGRGDLLVGAPGLASGGPGYARVLSGATGATLRTHPGTAPGDRQGLGLTGTRRRRRRRRAGLRRGRPRRGRHGPRARPLGRHRRGAAHARRRLRGRRVRLRARLQERHRPGRDRRSHRGRAARGLSAGAVFAFSGAMAASSWPSTAPGRRTASAPPWRAWAISTATATATWWSGPRRSIRTPR